MNITKMKNELKYEFYSCDFHRDKYKHYVWHWKYIPEEELEKCGFITDYNRIRLNRIEKRKEGENPIREYGLDGLILDSEGNYHGLQAKHWKSNKLTANDLGTFFSVILNRFVPKNIKSKGYLYHTCSLQIDLKDDIKNSQYIENYCLDMNIIKEDIKNNNETQYELYQPQKDALEKLKEDWEGVGLVSMPCALGKTVLLGNYLKMTNYNCIIILSPLRVLTKQMLDRIEKFIPEYFQLLVDSDCGGTTDEDYIFDIIEKKKCLISITYESFEHLFLDKHIENCLIVIDEAHNLGSWIEIMSYIEDEKTLLLTATPSKTLQEELDCNIIYEYTMREAINNNYITDYLINIPILDLEKNVVDIDIPTELKDLNNDFTLKSLFLISGLLETGSKKCIIYLTSIDECTNFNIIFKKICEEYHGFNIWCQSITADTSANIRTKILKEFENNEERISILSSVRILNEGVNIVKCDSVFITKVNDNEITAVQRLCRANRKDNENPNKIANCFIWADDMNKVVNMLQYLKDNDETQFFNKIVSRNGNYEKKMILEEKLKEVNYNKTFKNYIQIKSVNFEQRWKQRLEEVKEYINKNKKRPSQRDKNEEVKKLGQWVAVQKFNYPDKKNMKNLKIKELWEEFKNQYHKYFEKNIQAWINKLDEVINYINENKKLPSRTNENTKKIGLWIATQQINYPDKQSMKNEQIKTLYEKFINDYEEYFLDNKEIWKNNLEKVKNYIDENKKLPSYYDENTKTLAKWVSQQKQNYSKDEYIMKNDEIKSLWIDFINQYQEYFVNNEEAWKNNLEEVKKYIDKNKKLPSKHNEDTKTFGEWISTQQKNYPDKKIMKNEDIKKLYEEFINQYKQYFFSNEEIWKNKLEQVQEYINKNNKLPSRSQESTKSLNQWLADQSKNYSKNDRIMKNDEIKQLYEEFIDKNQQYFSTNIWKNKLEQVKNYIDEHKKRPSETNIETKVLGIWINHQNNSYLKNEMKKENIKLYEEFLKEYKQYFLNNKEKWLQNLEEVKKYIDENKKRPSQDKNETKTLGFWLSDQIKNYNKNIEIISDPEIRKIWEDFMNEYQDYFLTNEEKWLQKLEQVKNYINENKKLPHSRNDKILYTWLSTQKNNYPNKQILANQKFRELYEEFLNEFQEYF